MSAPESAMVAACEASRSRPRMSVPKCTLKVNTRNDAWLSCGRAQVVLMSLSMPEVGLGAALERFELAARGETFCTIDIVDEERASIVLEVLPEFPLEIHSDRARQFVEAWR